MTNSMKAFILGASALVPSVFAERLIVDLMVHTGMSLANAIASGTVMVTFLLIWILLMVSLFLDARIIGKWEGYVLVVRERLVASIRSPGPYVLSICSRSRFVGRGR